ncbi:MAG: hypothetical protein ACI35P_02820 [Bacillus sp. (in: firmicutes)]
MNIKQFYKTIAGMYLNISLLLTIISGLTFIFSYLYAEDNAIILAVFPFFLLSCMYFFTFLVYKRRYYHLPNTIPVNDRTPLEEEHILLVFMPAPTLHILLFHPKGKLLGEMKDGKSQWYKWFIPNSFSVFFPHSYELTDFDGNVLATYKQHRFFSTKQVFYNEKGEELAVYEQDWKKSLFRYKGEVTNQDKSIHMKIDVGGMVQSFSILTADHRKIVSFQKGWMPLEWGEKFKEFNTPILSFGSHCSDDEKLCIFGVCAYLLRYSKN